MAIAGIVVYVLIGIFSWNNLRCDKKPRPAYPAKIFAPDAGINNKARFYALAEEYVRRESQRI